MHRKKSSHSAACRPNWLRLLKCIYQTIFFLNAIDAIGLDKKDAEGYRLRSDGQGRLRLIMTVAGAAHAPFEQFVEPIKQHWKDVGIYLDLEVVERSLAITRGTANETQLSAWNNDGTEHPWTFPGHL